LRDQLIAELKDLNSAEQAADWAHRALASKNSLVLADAEQVEPAFQLKLSAFMTDQPTAVEHTKALRRLLLEGEVGQQASIKRSWRCRPRVREHVRSVGVPTASNVSGFVCPAGLKPLSDTKRQFPKLSSRARSGTDATHTLPSAKMRA
jgi:hypothetical protein